jgi:hypothetical protein
MVSDSALAGDGPLPLPVESRSIDGTGNNLLDDDLGAADTVLLRLTTIAYGDGVGSPSGADRPGARLISNLVAAHTGSVPIARPVSDFVWQWGQFLDHDIDLTGAADPAEPFDIPVPTGDPFFDPDGTGTEVIPLDRSMYVAQGGIRRQLNLITTYIDASNVYGSDAATVSSLRRNDGSGRMRTSRDGLLLPLGPDGFFQAGDVRANEQVGLTTMHTLFVREHNLWAFVFRALFPHKSGDEVFELARAMVGAEMQAITYNEFLPALLGEDALSEYEGYDSAVDPSIANVFSTAAYRFGHSMLSPTLLRLQRNGQPIPGGNVELRDAFFNPDLLLDRDNRGLAPILRGLAWQRPQEVDNEFVDDVRNFLFGPPGSGGFDLAALNFQRARDHGLSDYNTVRGDYGLPLVTRFSDISSNPDVVARLEDAYDSVDEIDPLVGMLCEDHVPGALVGETAFVILADQFERLRNGDRFFYKNHLPDWMIEMAEHSTLARIIRRNTVVGRELQANVFELP